MVRYIITIIILSSQAPANHNHQSLALLQIITINDDLVSTIPKRLAVINFLPLMNCAWDVIAVSSILPPDEDLHRISLLDRKHSSTPICVGSIRYPTINSPSIGNCKRYETSNLGDLSITGDLRVTTLFECQFITKIAAISSQVQAEETHKHTHKNTEREREMYETIIMRDIIISGNVQKIISGY